MVVRKQIGYNRINYNVILPKIALFSKIVAADLAIGDGLTILMGLLYPGRRSVDPLFSPKLVTCVLHYWLFLQVFS